LNKKQMKEWENAKNTVSALAGDEKATFLHLERKEQAFVVVATPRGILVKRSTPGSKS